MKIKGAFDQQFRGLDIMIISQRHHFLKTFFISKQRESLTQMGKL